jgi:hypothetical protein
MNSPRRGVRRPSSTPGRFHDSGLLKESLPGLFSKGPVPYLSGTTLSSDSLSSRSAKGRSLRSGIGASPRTHRSTTATGERRRTATSSMPTRFTASIRSRCFLVSTSTAPFALLRSGWYRAELQRYVRESLTRAHWGGTPARPWDRTVPRSEPSKRPERARRLN